MRHQLRGFYHLASFRSPSRWLPPDAEIISRLAVFLRSAGFRSVAYTHRLIAPSGLLNGHREQACTFSVRVAVKYVSPVLPHRRTHPLSREVLHRRKGR
jgi:hypothetical protein